MIPACLASWVARRATSLAWRRARFASLNSRPIWLVLVSRLWSLTSARLSPARTFDFRLCGRCMEGILSRGLGYEWCDLCLIQRSKVTACWVKNLRQRASLGVLPAFGGPEPDGAIVSEGELGPGAGQLDDAAG